MVYIITLDVDEVSRIKPHLDLTQRLTKALPTRMRSTYHGPQLALVLSQAGDNPDTNDRTLVWMGVVLRRNTVGAVDRSITIDPLRECREVVRLDGPEGLLVDLPEPHRKVFENITAPGDDVRNCEPETWNVLASALRRRYSSMAALIDWLTGLANAPILNSDTAEDRSWQEQRDALGTAFRIGGFSLSSVAAWARPDSRDAPYLAGLIPEPMEQSILDHDARVSGDPGLFDDWQEHRWLRCDIHVTHDPDGRRLEVANVNATPVESRLGTDLIYYHEATHSFVLVQYKRLNSRTRSIHVDKRLLSQMDRLEQVARLGGRPIIPRDWRLGSDPCFLKLTYWPEHSSRQELAPGMYLPLSYARILLEDDCTLGKNDGRIFGYDRIERYLVSTQFIDLVKHGMVGTIGTTVEQLRDLGTQRSEEGYSVLVAAERSSETVRERQQRVRARGPKKKTYVSRSYQQQTFFESNLNNGSQNL